MTDVPNQQEQQEVKTEVQINPFSSSSWNENPEPKKETVSNGENIETQQVTSAQVKVETPKEEEEVVEPSEWLKRELGIENVEDIKTRLKEYEELKSKPAGLKFENSASEKVFTYLKENKTEELYEFLSKQKNIERLISAEVDTVVSDEIIKTGLRLKHPELSEKEIEHKFRKDFYVPEKPVQKEDEDPDIYEERVKQWESIVESVNMDKVIEAKLLKQELQKAKETLILPDIEITPKQTQQTQEELDKLAKLQADFEKAVDENYKAFNGFTVSYKDEEVEFPVTFGFDENSSKSLADEIKKFDVDQFIQSRWFNQDGSPNVKQTMEDIALLRNKEAVFQKLVNETGAQIKKEYIKQKANITVTGSGKEVDIKAGNGQFNPFKQESWSERPTITASS